jgi:hypothetical protein
MAERPTFTDRVADLFRSMPGQWIDGRTLAQVGGFAAWRSRVSDARLAYGMDIRNRQRRETRDGREVVVTEYCYFPQPRALEHAEDQPLPWEAA